MGRRSCGQYNVLEAGNWPIRRFDECQRALPGEATPRVLIVASNVRESQEIPTRWLEIPEERKLILRTQNVFPGLGTGRVPFSRCRDP